jgi:putative endonuclease
MKKKENIASTSIGRAAEKMAEQFLIEKGHQILQKNFHYSTIAEIDLISLDGDELVFTEVKSRSNINDHFPERAVNHHKQSKISSAARFFLKNYHHEGLIRFDVISVITSHQDSWKIDHFEHAFVPVQYY